MDTMAIADMKAKDAVRYIAGVPDVAELDALQVMEVNNPNVPGGRLRVLESIDARRGELSIPAETEKAPPPPPADLSPDKPWREDRWAGHPQFNCRTCPFQTLEAPAIEQHVAAAHPMVWRPYLKTLTTMEA